MANYDGVHDETYTVRGKVYVRLWWYTGAGSERKAQGIGARDKLTKADIARARKDKEAELAKRPELIRAGEAPTLGAWWDEYLSYRPGLNDRTEYHLKRTHELMVEFWGKEKRLDKIDKKDVAKWRAWLAGRLTSRTKGQGPTEATICMHIRQGSGLFGVHSGAAKYHPSVRNPFEGEPMNAQVATKGHPQLSMADLAALIGAAPTKASACLIALCAYAGFRQGEGLRLQWADVQWEANKVIATTTKNTGAGKGKTREVLMVPELARVLLAAHEAGLASPCPGLASHTAYEELETAIAAAGLDPWDDPFQALRRWRDTTWKAQGHPEFVVDAWLGHSLAVSRKHYLAVPASMYQPAKAADPGILSDLTEAELDQVRKFVAEMKNRRNIGATSDAKAS